MDSQTILRYFEKEIYSLIPKEMSPDEATSLLMRTHNEMARRDLSVYWLFPTEEFVVQFDDALREFQ